MGKKSEETAWELHMAQGFGDRREKDAVRKYSVNKRTEQFLFESIESTSQ